MHNPLRLLARVLIITSGLILAGCGQRYPGVPAKGAPAPDFTLLNQDGKPVSLKDYRGQWIVLFFYHQDFGKESTADLHSFQRDLRKLQALHTVVLGISGDDVSSHKAFVDQQQLPFTLLSDKGMVVIKQYGTLHRANFAHLVLIYSSFIVDPEGKIASVLYDFSPTDPGGEVLSALNALQHS